jgi:hypothetical protein
MRVEKNRQRATDAADLDGMGRPSGNGFRAEKLFQKIKADASLHPPILSITGGCMTETKQA